MAQPSDEILTGSGTTADVAPIPKRILAGIFDSMIVAALFSILWILLSGILCVLAGSSFFYLFQNTGGWQMNGVMFLIGALEGLTCVSPFAFLFFLTQASPLLQVTTWLAFFNHPIGRLLVVIPMLFLINWLYHAIMESSSKRSTLGKAFIGIAVTDMTGNRISFGKATVRHLAKSVSTLILGIGYIMAATCKTRRALHDKLSGCQVVKTRT